MPPLGMHEVINDSCNFPHNQAVIVNHFVAFSVNLNMGVSKLIKIVYDSPKQWNTNRTQILLGNINVNKLQLALSSPNLKGTRLLFQLQRGSDYRKY